ncbi:unnamed protein product [Blepharisma stoltei]|uniref:Uncharacterized protein n=1 Tax=Blepharisma stoltei TaxID=1481888 RepID=A0AAU9IAW4_9CILI|nr:unnamed protein product [Blepharisma stoltei]
MVSTEGEVNFSFKLVILGDSGVGKTNLLQRFTKNIFSLATRSSMGFNNDYKTLDIEGKTVRAEIWDTPGQDRYRAMLNPFYRGAVGALLVYDLTNAETFTNLQKWMKEIKNYGESIETVLLIGNKSDKEEERNVKQSDAMAFAQKNGIAYIETSALNANNVDKAFEIILTNLVKNKTSNIPAPAPPKLDVEGKSKKIGNEEHRQFDDTVRKTCSCSLL